MVLPFGYDIAKAYEKGDLFGWAERDNPGISKTAFNLLAGEFRPFNIFGQTQVTTGRKTFLTDVVRSVLGRNLSIGPQQTGDCVSWGGKHASEIVTCTQIAGLAVINSQGDAQAFRDIISAARMKYRDIFAPYYYGIGRIYEGGGQLGRSAGSLGSWQFAAAKKYGALFEDENGVPKYSKDVADAWGYDRQYIDKFRNTAAAYPVKSGAQIGTWADFCASIHNGYAVTTATSLGYSMEAGRDGFHIQNTRWDHQMCWVGVDETYAEPYALLMNQWGDVHGELKDFQTGEKLPPGLLRVRRSDVEKHLYRGENYSYSSFEGFPEQRLDKAAFMLI